MKRFKYEAIFLAGLLSSPIVSELNTLSLQYFGVNSDFITVSEYGIFHGLSRRCTKEIIQPRYDGMEAMTAREYFTCGWLNIQISDWLYGSKIKN
jgi:hypothetical protein